MDLLFGTVLQGLINGCIIALLAAGITIVHRSTRVLNFAHGSIATLNTYLYYQLAVTWGWPAFAAFPVTLVLAFAVGIASEQLAVRPLASADPTTRSAGTIGLVLILQWVVISIWGAGQRFLPVIGSGGISVGGVTLGAQHLAIAAGTAVVGIGVAVLLAHTRLGLALVATADDPVAARLLGVGSRAVSMVTFGLAGMTAAVAGILATPLLVLTPSQMTLVFVVALGAALAGGFENLPRTVAAGLALGVVQSLVTSYASYGGLPQATGFLAVLVVLMIVRHRVSLADVMRGAA